VKGDIGTNEDIPLSRKKKLEVDEINALSEAKEVELRQEENILKEKEVSSMHFKFPRN
jgi:hypothetical protein